MSISKSFYNTADIKRNFTQVSAALVVMLKLKSLLSEKEKKAANVKKLAILLSSAEKLNEKVYINHIQIANMLHNFGPFVTSVLRHCPKIVADEVRKGIKIYSEKILPNVIPENVATRRGYVYDLTIGNGLKCIKLNESYMGETGEIVEPMQYHAEYYMKELIKR